MTDEEKFQCLVIFVTVAPIIIMMLAYFISYKRRNYE